MGKGRKPLPEGVKLLQGTSQPSRQRKEVPVDKLSEVLTIEDVRKNKTMHTARARRIFIDRANALIAMKIIAEVDVDQLAVYANTLELYEKASKSIAKEGAFKEDVITKTSKDGEVTEEPIIIPNPYMKHYKGMIDTINRLGSEFGFSPVARTKINAGSEEPVDEFEKAMEAFK